MFKEGVSTVGRNLNCLSVPDVCPHVFAGVREGGIVHHGQSTMMLAGEAPSYKECREDTASSNVSWERGEA